MKFYNREAEIAIFNRLKKDFRIAVLGRRRVGKTKLIEHFYAEKCLTLFVSAEKSEKEIILSWIREYHQFNLPQVNTLNEFFEFLFVHLADKIIFIDELQNVIKVNKSFLFDLQRLIDKYKPKLIVSGSLISMMKSIVQDYKSPIYGRFDYIIHLKELDFKTVCKICRELKLDIKTIFILYFVFGGIPKYYELLEKLDHFEVNDIFLDLFVKYPRPLYEEVRTMLKEEFGSEHKTFFSILSAISQGKNKQSEIADCVGRKPTEITKYLLTLRKDFEIIERKLPVIGGEKRGLYFIKNNIFSFWFSTVWRYNEMLETGNESEVLVSVKKILNNHYAFAFENIIRELISSETLKIPFESSKIGSQWGKFKGEKGKNTYEIDVVALNEKTKDILFGECKWQENVSPEEILEEISKKAKFVNWNDNERNEIYAIFAKSFKNKIKEWNGKKVICYDLNDISESF